VNPLVVFARKRKTKWEGKVCTVTMYTKIFIGYRAFSRLFPARSLALCEQHHAQLHRGELGIHDLTLPPNCRLVNPEEFGIWMKLSILGSTSALEIN